VSFGGGGYRGVSAAASTGLPARTQAASNSGNGATAMNGRSACAATIASEKVH
jgi:hypothetical protein